MDIQSKITKLTDLEANDSLSCFDGHCAQQNHNVYQVFYDFISSTKPSRILEIGTAMGGFTKFLDIVIKDLNLKTNIRSYDIHARNWYSDMVEEGIDIRVENIFSEDWQSIKQEVIDYIQQPGITVILCDGGWKKGEYNLLSNYLKDGDFILGHDYAYDKQDFNSNIFGKIWNWHELSFKDVKSSIERNNLEFYQQDVFSKVVWLCTQKKVK